MLSIGIIWNSAYKYKAMIEKDLREKVVVSGIFDFDFSDNDYIEFVWKIYSSEQMEKWKIENKLAHMITSQNRKISIIFFDFDDKNIEYHPFKKKNVFTELESCKKYIREKYEPYVENYTFDIIFHATDNIDELKKCFSTIKQFLESKQLTNDEIKQLKKINQYGKNIK